MGHTATGKNILSIHMEHMEPAQAGMPGNDSRCFLNLEIAFGKGIAGVLWLKSMPLNQNIKSENHGIVWVARDTKNHLVTTP